MSLVSGDVVWTLFPYVGTNRQRARPALILASGLGADAELCWALMITNAERPVWLGDVPIADHEACHLPIPSKIRTEKIATLATARVNLLGRLDAETMKRVRAAVARRVVAP